MPKRPTLILSEVSNMEDKKANIIDEYKELDAECDKVIEKIVKRKSRRAKKSAA